MSGLATFDPNTSFPGGLREAIFDDLESEPFVSLSLCFCFSSGEEVCSAVCAEGFPSKRLPEPVNGLNRATFVGGSSSTEMQRIKLKSVNEFCTKEN